MTKTVVVINNLVKVADSDTREPADQQTMTGKLQQVTQGQATNVTTAPHILSVYAPEQASAQ